ncbi:UNVERIFIED_CONTAM: putative germin-like protein 9-2 [Sesamum calycinum]|uniref:Germin-like protein n=1 Tax=Sesamum calycinum TaxID=2727403 RepID=A0AAW2LUJ3_9LAMI
MASKYESFLLLLALITVFTLRPSLAADPDTLSDFIAPPNTTVDGEFFTYTGLRSFIGATPPNFTVYKATMAQLPALNGQSVSYAALFYPPGSVNPTHTHPRASELLFLLVGCLEVGFVDTTNHLFTQTLQQGDIFVFPKGLFTISTTRTARTRPSRFPHSAAPVQEQFLSRLLCSTPVLMTLSWLLHSKLMLQRLGSSSMGSHIKMVNYPEFCDVIILSIKHHHAARSTFHSSTV